MDIIKILAGPLIGAVIGYFTNYIAVKMLFYPRKEIYLLGKKLPFTPGAIPKGKSRLAKAIGNIVGTTLVTKDDIETALLSDHMTETVADSVMPRFSRDIKGNIIDIADIDEEKYNEYQNKVSEVITKDIVKAMVESDLSSVIISKGKDRIKDKLQNSMFGMFVNDSMIKAFTEPLGDQLSAIISEDGYDFIKPAVDSKLEDIGLSTGVELLADYNVNEDEIRNIVVSAYKKLVSSNSAKVMDNLNISALVEEKMNNMSVEELEKLVLQVMKKELNTIVNLGALIGFILGLINIIFK